MKTSIHEFSILALTILLITSCGSDSESDSESDSSAPQILSFTVSPNSAAGPTSAKSTGDSITFFLVVTDPDGIGDVIGGTLMDETSDATYASLTTGAEEGSYTVTLTWASINQALPITFEDEQLRSFRARVFDQSGAFAEAIVDVSLHCDGAASCDGACVNLQSDNDNCSVCGHTCDQSTCQSGACRALVCDFFSSANCDAVCAGTGLACEPCDSTSPKVGTGFASSSCALFSDDPEPVPVLTCSASLAGFGSASCCCAPS